MALTKVFRIELAGAKVVEDGAKKIAEAYRKMSADVKAAKSELARNVSIGADTSVVTGLTSSIREQEIALQQLAAQKNIAEKQAESQARTEKLLADARLKEAQAQKAQEAAEATRTKTLIAQERELERLILLEEKRKKAETSSTTSSSAGIDLSRTRLAVQSTTTAAFAAAPLTQAPIANAPLPETLRQNILLNAQYKLQLESVRKELTALKTETDAATKETDEYKQQVVELTRQELQLKTATADITQTIRQQFAEFNAAEGSVDQMNARLNQLRKTYNSLTADQKNSAFGRELIRDIDALDAKLKEENARIGVFVRNVGDYEQSIIRAFRGLGLDDFIKGDIDAAKLQLDSLTKKTNELVVAYRRAQTEGSQDLNKLQKEIHDNVEETERLRKSIVSVETQMNGFGNIGSQVTTSLKESFRDMRGQLGQFLLGYVGFQAAIQAASKGVRINFDFEDTANELKAITGAAGEDLKFLKNQAVETAKATGISSVEILESFKLIASAKPELLENVEGLNQIKDAAVTLAEASGQSLPESVNSLTKVLNQFNADADQSGKFIDALAAGAKFGAAEIPQITSALLEFGTQAKSSNVSVQESIGIIELLAEKGILAGEAGTKLRNVFLTLNAAGALDKGARESLQAAGVDMKKLGDNSLSLEDRLRELSKIQNDNTAIVKVFGKENFNAAQIVLQNVSRYAQLADQVKETGVAQEQAAQNTNSASVAWAKLREQLVAMITSENVAKFLTGLASVLSFLVGNLSLTIPLIAAYVVINSTWVASIMSATAAYRAQAAAWLLERIQIIVSNTVRIISTTLINLHTAATIRSATASGVAAVAYRILASAIALMSGPMGIVVGLIVAFTTVVGVFSARAKSAANSTSEWAKKQAELAEQQKITVELTGQIAKETEATKNRIQELVSVIQSETASQAEKEKALKRLIEISPSYLNGLTLENATTAEGIAIINRYISSLDQLADAKARVNLKAKLKEQQLENKNDLDALGSEKKTTTKLSKTDKFLYGDDGKFFGMGDRNESDVDKDLKKKEAEGAALERRLKALSTGNDAKIAAYRKSINDGNAVLKTVKPKSVEAVRIAQDIATSQKALNILLGLETDAPALNGATATETGKTKKVGASSLTGQQKDQQKILDAELDQYRTALEKAYITRSEFKKKFDELAIETSADGNVSITNRQRQSVTITDEKTYLTTLLSLNNEYLDKKIEALRGNNAEEQKQRADFELQKIKNVQETNKKLFELDNQQLERTRQLRDRQAKDRLDLGEQDQTITFVERVQLQEAYYSQLLQNQIVFNEGQVRLEKLYGIYSVENEQKRADAIENIQIKLRDIRRTTVDAELKDIQSAATKQISQYNINYSRLRQAILDNDNLTAEQKTRNIERLNRMQNVTILSAELAQLVIEFEKKKELFEQSLISEAEYLRALEAMEKKKEDVGNAKKEAKKATVDLPSAQNTQKLFGNQLSKDLGFDKDSLEDQLLGEIIAQSFQLATEAMNAFFDAQRQRIEEEKNLKLASLDRERERVKNRAQSAAEEETIDRQYNEKKKAIEREAGERLKKSKKAEAAIALSTELANIGVAASANPANGVTLGAAGIVMYSILSALALGRFAMNIAAINKQQFAFGGSIRRFAFGGKLTNDEELFTQSSRKYSYGGNISRNDEEIFRKETKKYAYGGRITSTEEKLLQQTSKKYAYGGDVPTRGGRFGGRSHAQGGTPFRYAGQEFEAEVDELAIIRTRNAPKNRIFRIEGTQSQIASQLNQIGGGRPFSSGGNVKRFEFGGLVAPKPMFAAADRLQAPYFTANMNSGFAQNTTANDGRIERLEAMTEQVLAAVMASDSKEVVLNPGKVTEHQRQTKLSQNLGTI